MAAVTIKGVFLSWRLLGSEVTGSSAAGLAGAAFRVYRDRRLIATVTDSTNYLDPAGDGNASYRVAPVVRGRELARSTAGLTLVAELHRPAAAEAGRRRHPDGEAYTYSANDMSVGDVDGDGTYEYVVKWDPVELQGRLPDRLHRSGLHRHLPADGTLLHRLDLGVNIRAGAHYTQFMVYDFDGDGRSEMMLKTAPGTKTDPLRQARPGRPPSATSPCRVGTGAPATPTPTTTG